MFARERRAFDDSLVSGIDWVLPDWRLDREIVTALDVGYLSGADLWHVATALYVALDLSQLFFLTLDGSQRSVRQVPRIPGLTTLRMTTLTAYPLRVVVVHVSVLAVDHVAVRPLALVPVVRARLSPDVLHHHVLGRGGEEQGDPKHYREQVIYAPQDWYHVMHDVEGGGLGR